MAEKRQFLDVWIIEANTVYRAVPFNVVTDWVQEGRLLENDKLQPSGTDDWFTVGGNPTFAAYLPRSEPHRVEDQAEALESVQIDFAWRRRSDDEEGDVDMIPLIDVSLVLLVFFIMTTTSVAASWFIKTPTAVNTYVRNDPELIWIGMDKDDNGNVLYSLGQGNRGPAKEATNLKSQAELLQQLDALLAEKTERVDVNIRANEDLPTGEVRKMIIELGRKERRDKISNKYQGVSAIQ